MILVCSSGRSGSGLIADLARLNDLKSSHEDSPDLFLFGTKLTHPNLKYLSVNLWLNILRLKKIEIETSHIITKGFVEYINFSRISGVILVNRNIDDVALSLLRLNTIPFQSKKGRKYLTRKKFMFVKCRSNYSEFELCLAYALDQKIYNFLVKSLLKSKGVPFFELAFEELITEQAQVKLVEWSRKTLGLRANKVQVKTSKSNSKKDKKLSLPSYSPSHAKFEVSLQYAAQMGVTIDKNAVHAFLSNLNVVVDVSDY